MAINDYRFVTREQFGQDLYDCIQKFSERQWIRNARQRMIEREEQTVTLLHHGKMNKRRLDEYEAKLTKDILALFPKLAPADQQRLLAKYETPVAV